MISFFLLLVPVANADPGIKFWGMDVGNYWIYAGTTDPPRDSWTWRSDVVAKDGTTIPGVTTYVIDNLDNGVLNGCSPLFFYNYLKSLHL